MIKVIHNSKCPKSRAILEYLDENDIKFQIIDVIKEPLSLFELRTLFKNSIKNQVKFLENPKIFSTNIFLIMKLLMKRMH